MRCNQCESESFEELNGHYVCTVCGLQSAEAIVTVFEDLLEEGNFEEGAGGGANRWIRAVRTGPRRTRSWVSWEEAIQTILRAQCDILIADFGFPAQMTQLVGKLWFHYLASVVPSHRSKSGAQNTKARDRRESIQKVRKEHLQQRKQYLLKPQTVLENIMPPRERARKRAAERHPLIPLDSSSAEDDAPLARGSTKNAKRSDSTPTAGQKANGAFSPPEWSSVSEWSGASVASEDISDVEEPEEPEMSEESNSAPKAATRKRKRAPSRSKGFHGSEDSFSSSESLSSSSSGEESSENEKLTFSGGSDDSSTSDSSDTSGSSSEYEGEFPTDEFKIPVMEGDLPDFIVSKQRGAHYTTLLRESLTIHLTLELLYIAVLYLRVPVLPGDLVEWAATGKLPYLTAYQLLPTSMSYYRYLKPYSVPTTNILVKKAIKLASNLKIETPIPSLNQFALISRMATLLEVAPEVERAAIRLMKISKWEAKFGLTEHPYNMVFVHLLIAIKLLYPFNDTYGLSGIALDNPNITAKCLPEWLNEQFKLDKKVPITTPWIRHELDRFPNTSIEGYIDFLKYQHTDKMRLTPEIAELQNMFDSRGQGQSLHHPITQENQSRNLGYGGQAGPDGEDAATRLPCYIDYGQLRAYLRDQPIEDADEIPEAPSQITTESPNAESEPQGHAKRNRTVSDAPRHTTYVAYHDQFFAATPASHEYLIEKGVRLLSTTRNKLIADLFFVENRVLGKVSGRRRAHAGVKMSY